MNTEKFTLSAAKRIEEAQMLALAESHSVLVPLHLLVSVLRAKESINQDLLVRVGVDVDTFLRRAEEAMAKLPKVFSSQPQLSMDGEMGTVLNRSQIIAQGMRDSYVTEEHLFLALIEMAKSLEALFATFALTYEKYKAVVTELRNGETVTSNDAENLYEALKKYTIDLVELARKGKIDPVIGREEEIRRTIQILSRRTKNNPVLIGDPGVGKTAIVE